MSDQLVEIRNALKGDLYPRGMVENDIRFLLARLREAENGAFIAEAQVRRLAEDIAKEQLDFLNAEAKRLRAEIDGLTMYGEGGPVWFERCQKAGVAVVKARATMEQALGERERLNQENDQWQKKLAEVWQEVATLRTEVERLREGVGKLKALRQKMDDADQGGDWPPESSVWLLDQVLRILEGTSDE